MGTNGGYGRHNPRVTPKDRRAILQAHDDGESAASLARRYGCHPSAVRYHLLCTLRVIPVRDRAVMGPITRGLPLRHRHPPSRRPGPVP